MTSRSNYATNVTPGVLDVETGGDAVKAAPFLEPPLPDSRLRDPDKIAADIAAKTAARLEKIALDWNVGTIACIGFWSEDLGYLITPCRNEAEEAEAIAQTWELLKFRTIIGFNVKGFDARFLVQRSRYLGIPHPTLDFSKYSRKGIIDLYLDLTFGDGHYDQGAMRRTLKMFAKRFGIPVADALDGKDMPALIAAGEWAAVAAHCRSDVELTVALARKLGVLQPAPAEVTGTPTVEKH